MGPGNNIIMENSLWMIILTMQIILRMKNYEHELTLRTEDHCYIVFIVKALFLVL